MGVPIYLRLHRQETRKGEKKTMTLTIINIRKRIGIVLFLGYDMLRRMNTFKYAWESSLEFNYHACIKDAGTLLITIVTPAKILTILLRIKFIPHDKPKK